MVGFISAYLLDEVKLIRNGCEFLCVIPRKLYQLIYQIFFFNR